MKSPEPIGRFAEVELRVPFHDCDPANIVWHGHYAKYFELARCALLESFNYNYDRMADSGYIWPVIDFQARYVKPAVFNQLLRVRCVLVEWQFRLKLEYLITDVLSGERLTKGISTQVAVHRATGEMQLASPDALRLALGLPAAEVAA